MNPIVFLVLAVVLIGGAFYLVALPILQHARRASTPPSLTSEQEHLDNLLANRDSAFQALRELSFDHRVGKITDEDFIAFEAYLKRNAAETLRALDEWEGEADDHLDQIMERAIQERAHALKSDHNVGLDGPDGRICPKCGKLASAADRFCGGCGAALPALPTPATLSAPELTCPHCGRAYQPGDKFCAGCGQGLVVRATSRSAS